MVNVLVTGGAGSIGSNFVRLADHCRALNAWWGRPIRNEASLRQSSGAGDAARS